MPNPARLHPPSRLPFTALFALALAACGGGGGDAPGDGASVAISSPAPSGSSATASPPATAASAVVLSATDKTGNTGTTVPPTTTPTSEDLGNGAVVSALQALSANASLVVNGVPETATAAALATVSATGRTFYVDSQTGNDSSDGLAGTVASATRGPWRTLARLMTSDITAGDTVRLACGSVWRESLRLPRSGTTDRPIIVTQPTGGCTTAPAIDGSIAIAASAWTLHQGQVYKAALTVPPLDVTSVAATGASTPVWTEAHHPNRGYAGASAPQSPYLKTAAKSLEVLRYGQPAAISVETGSDLVLPAGATIGAGTRARIRVYSWFIQERPVASATVSRLNLSSSLWYPLGAGWGYFLLGQQWMVDSDREWYHNASTNTLYAYFADGRPTAAVNATTLPVGINLAGRTNVTVEGLQVRRVGLGADLQGSSDIVIRNGRVSETVDMGVDATGSTRVMIESNVFFRTGTDTVSGWRHDSTTASNALTVRNNIIRDSGVVMQGETVISLPRASYAAVYGGTNSVISGNTVINSGYIGIQAMAQSLIEKNFVYGACSVLDDCAAIYTQYADTRSVIRGNTVMHSRGTKIGKPATELATAAQGIYLDDYSSGVTVEDNTVIDADNGIQLHIASNNVVRNNRLYGNRISQLWMQADRNRDHVGGDMINNTVTDNLIAPTTQGASGMWLDTLYASTAAFGLFDRNVFYDRISTVAVLHRTAAGFFPQTLNMWRQAVDPTMPPNREVNGRATSDTFYSAFAVSGTNIVPNASLLSNTTGWTWWNATAPAIRVVRETCAPGRCLRYLPGGSAGLISSPNFSVQRSQWYRISVDLQADRDDTDIYVIVRRGSGNYELVGTNGSTNYIWKGGQAWKRYSAVFQSNVAINANDPLTGDLGARVDISPRDGARTVSLANVELVALTPDSGAQASAAVINVGTAARSMACPTATASPDLCGKFRNFTNDSLVVTWPLSVPARSSAILYAQQPGLIDTDRDGVPDATDACANTPAGSAVNASGCPLLVQ